jgi:hypothetical protein
MEDISRFILTRDARPLRGVPRFGTLAHSPGAERVDPAVVVFPNP